MTASPPRAGRSRSRTNAVRRAHQVVGCLLPLLLIAEAVGDDEQVHLLDGVLGAWWSTIASRTKCDLLDTLTDAEGRALRRRLMRAQDAWGVAA
jgi:hypothetical protein